MNSPWIKKVYLYLVSLIALVIIVVGSIQLLNLALKQWVFTKADRDYYYPVVKTIDCTQLSETDRKAMIECTDPNYAENEMQRQKDSRTAQKQRDAANAIAMIVVGTPVFYFHFKLARKET